MNITYQTPIGPMQLQIPMPHLMDRGEKVWHDYYPARQQDKVTRAGFIYCGCCPDVNPEEHPNPGHGVGIIDNGELTYSKEGCRSESVSEHSFGCIKLLTAMVDHYPELFTKNHEKVSDNSSQLDHAIRRFTELMSVHDLPETLNGDGADDGHLDEAEHNKCEANNFARFINPRKIALLNDYMNFQNPLFPYPYSGWTPYDGEFIQVIKLGDKVDGFLRSLIYEKDGHAGHLSYKERHFNAVTTKDRDYERIAGTDNFCDILGMHFFDDYHEYFGFQQYLEVMHAAVKDIRGEWFTWIGNFNREKGLNISVG